VPEQLPTEVETHGVPMPSVVTEAPPRIGSKTVPVAFMSRASLPHAAAKVIVTQMIRVLIDLVSFGR
jgi:hypothetical protein